MSSQSCKYFLPLTLRKLSWPKAGSVQDTLPRSGMEETMGILAFIVLVAQWPNAASIAHAGI